MGEMSESVFLTHLRNQLLLYFWCNRFFQLIFVGKIVAPFSLEAGRLNNNNNNNNNNLQQQKKYSSTLIMLFSTTSKLGGLKVD